MEVQRHSKLFINGRWEHSAKGDVMESIYPGNGQMWATVPAASAEDVDRAVRAARRAMDKGPWAASGSQRAMFLRKLAAALRSDSERLAQTETMDTGKAIRETRDQTMAAAGWCEYYAGWADKLEGRYIPIDKDFFAHTMIAPVGVVAGLLPSF